MQDFSTNKITSSLMSEVKSALQSVKSYGSVEIYIQNGIVTQITVRNIKKTVREDKKKMINSKLS